MSKSRPVKRRANESASSWLPLALGGGFLFLAAAVLIWAVVLRRGKTEDQSAVKPGPVAPVQSAPAVSAPAAGATAVSAEIDKELAEASSEADRLDPGWRTQQLEAKRKHPSPDRDSVPFIRAAAQSPDFQKGRASDAPLMESLENLPPNVALSPQQTQALRAALQKLSAALNQARKVIDRPEGFHPIAWSKDGISTLLPTVPDARVVSDLLRREALLQAQTGDVDGALASVRGMLNAAYSLADVPGSITMLVRVASDQVAITSLQRALAQGQPGAAALAAVQERLDVEATAPLLLFSMRGERAMFNDFLTVLATDQFDGQQLQQWQGPEGEALRRIASSRDKAELRAAQVWLLRTSTKMVEIAKLPIEKQAEPLKGLSATFATAPTTARSLLPAVDRLFLASQRGTALARCAVAGVAAERYRRSNGRWPESLVALVEAKLLSGVALDPFDGAPLRYRRLDDGVVIYAVGQDGKDNNGTLPAGDNRKLVLGNMDGLDVGFRLWDVTQRHLAPR